MQMWIIKGSKRSVAEQSSPNEDHYRTTSLFEIEETDIAAAVHTTKSPALMERLLSIGILFAVVLIANCYPG